jgi:hypothetical protein
LATTSGRDAWGIIALTGVLAGSSIHIVNTGDLQVSGVAQGLGNIPTAGIAAQSFLAADSPIAIENEGALTVSALANAFGIVAYTSGANSPISIENRGDIAATGAAYGYGTTVEGIRAAIFGASSPVAIVNSGNLSATGIGAEARAYAIDAKGYNYSGSPLSIINSGDLTARAGQATGIFASSQGGANGVSITNSGDVLAVASTYSATAIFAATVGPGGFTIVTNSGNLTAIVAGSAPYSRAIGISAEGGEANTPVTVVNSGTISASGGLASFGIYAATDGANSPISITNSGTIDPAIGIFASTQGQGSPITIHNSGTVFGIGISADTKYGATTIFNSGNISAGSLFAINVNGGPATIYNAGLITGFIDLTDNNDTFINQDHGVFETKLTSYFGAGNDLFRNEEGGTVLAATNRNASEYSSFVGLERFENQGPDLAAGRAGRRCVQDLQHRRRHRPFLRRLRQIDSGDRRLPGRTGLGVRRVHRRRECVRQD